MKRLAMTRIVRHNENKPPIRYTFTPKHYRSVSQWKLSIIHTKLDCKINLAFMYAVFYQGYSKRKALS